MQIFFFKIIELTTYRWAPAYRQKLEMLNWYVQTFSVRDYLREVVSAPLQFWALVPHYMWDRYVYTSKLGSAVP